MAVPQRALTTSFPVQNRENQAKPGKLSAAGAAVRPSQRPILRDIKPSNRNVPLLKKPAATAVPKKATTVVKQQPEASLFSHSSLQLATILNVDEGDAQNPFLVSEYVLDIFKYLRQLERTHVIEDKYLADHQTTVRMRSVLINWMVDVCINFKFLQETLFLSVNILDRYLQVRKNVGRDVLQLAGVASMVVASKYEEIYTPAIHDFVYIADNSFTAKEIFKTEMDILNGLGFNLGRPLSLHFLRRYSKVAGSDFDQHNLAKYFLEVFLLDYEICAVYPSLQAAASCCLAISVLGDSSPVKVWNKTLEHYSSYKYADLKPIMIKLVLAFRKMEKSKFQSIKKKYADKKLGNISGNLKLQTSKLLKDIYEKCSV